MALRCRRLAQQRRRYRLASLAETRIVVPIHRDRIDKRLQAGCRRIRGYVKVPELPIGFDVSSAPENVSAAVHEVIASKRHKLTGEGSDDRHISFVTRKSMLSWELDAQVTITPTATGSHVDLELDTSGNRPTALLDGKKNKKCADKLAQEIQAAVD